MFTFIGVRIKSAPGCQIRVPLVYITSVFAFQSSSEIICHFIEFRAGTVSISVQPNCLQSAIDFAIIHLNVITDTYGLQQPVALETTPS